MKTDPLGVYLSLFDEGAGPDPDLKAVGPFDDFLVRSGRVIANRARLGQLIAAHESDGRWVSEDPALGSRGLTRSHIRVTGDGDKVYVRLFSGETDESAEAELGPFAVITVGTHEVRGDGRPLAVRIASSAPWLVTDAAGAELQGHPDQAIGFSATSRAPAGARRVKMAADAAAAKDAPPSVWVDRPRPAADIYISRPERKR